MTTVLLETAGKLIFFALMLLLCVYLGFLLYDALVPDDPQLEILSQKITYLVCDRDADFNKVCPGSMPKKNIHYLRIPEDHALFAFSEKDEKISVVSTTKTHSLPDVKSSISEEYVNPCKGACLCLSKVKKPISIDDCEELPFELQTWMLPVNYQVFSRGVGNAPSHDTTYEYKTSRSNANQQNLLPVFIYPAVIPGLSAKQDYYLLGLYLEYTPESQLIITPYTPSNKQAIRDRQ